MEQIYRRTELKFKVVIEATGFDMQTDNWNIQVVCGNKNVPLGKIDGVLDDGLVYKENDGYYAMVDTSDFPAGTVKLIATAFVPDSDATDGVRNEVSVTNICQLINT